MKSTSWAHEYIKCPWVLIHYHFSPRKRDPINTSNYIDSRLDNYPICVHQNFLMIPNDKHIKLKKLIITNLENGTQEVLINLITPSCTFYFDQVPYPKAFNTYDPLCILFLSVLRSIGFLIILRYDVNCFVFTGRRKGQELSSLSNSEIICLKEKENHH